MRERVAASVLAKPSGFWEQRARAQLRLTIYSIYTAPVLPDDPPAAVARG